MKDKQAAEKSVLIVEDSDSYRETLGQCLGSRFNCVCAASAEEGFAALEERTPNLMLLDIHLPGISGVDMLKTLSTSRPSIPVIMVTSSKDVPQIVECMRLGAEDYLVKPVALDELMFAVDRAIRHADVRDELEQRRRLQDLDFHGYQLIGTVHP